ncbi:hypothetical protein GCM10010215_17710 [Streptomyces virginiae]|uniref:Uncharacterized protein n=1 Tax=Streptomyces virginiae TaxID=1961 RepID=A0ABQ3NXB2_STRVG|nr:hypothetical protein GCM10010215_17710 [Streptomyces virginiae]GHI17414.1 hypothetical protein Scinn_68770 [Streptomyces virginiae]
MEDVSGVWTSNRGGRIIFTNDGTVSFNNVTQDPYCVPEELRKSPPRKSGDGKWVFETIPDESPGVRIQFPTGEEQPKTCSLYAIWVGPRPYSRMYLRQDDGGDEHYDKTPEGAAAVNQ